MSQVVEFSVGDEVTYRPYQKRIRAKVVDRWVGSRMNVSREPDDRVFYKLTGVSAPLLTETTGGSIVESIYYDKSKESKLADREYVFNPEVTIEDQIAFEGLDQYEQIKFIDKYGQFL